MGLDGIFDVLILIEHLNSLAPLTPDQIVRLHEEERERLLEKLEVLRREVPESSGSIPRSQLFPPTAFQKDGADNDLIEQVSVLSRNFNTYMRTGWACPPHAAWRIAIILRRMKEPKLEREFLTAWVRHFPIGPGGTFDKLAGRLGKVQGR